MVRFIDTDTSRCWRDGSTLESICSSYKGSSWVWFTAFTCWFTWLDWTCYIDQVTGRYLPACLPSAGMKGIHYQTRPNKSVFKKKYPTYYIHDSDSTRRLIPDTHVLP